MHLVIKRIVLIKRMYYTSANTCLISAHIFCNCSMEAVERQNCRQNPLEQSRRSYNREQKLHVLRWYTSNGSNLYRTCQKFDLNTKTVLWWIKNHKAIHDSKKGRKRVSFKRTPEYPEMEKALHEEYQGLRHCGLKVKGWWFRTRGQWAESKRMVI